MQQYHGREGKEKKQINLNGFPQDNLQSINVVPKDSGKENGKKENRLKKFYKNAGKFYYYKMKGDEN